MKHLVFLLIGLTLAGDAWAYSYSQHRQMKTYYVEDIWAEEMFIEPTKSFIAEEFARYGYRHTPNKEEADVRVHLTIHSVKNKPHDVRPFVIWPVTSNKRDIGEARISARVIDNETNKEIWANSIKGRALEDLMFGWIERPRTARMRAFNKALGYVFDPFFVSDMPLFD